MLERRVAVHTIYTISAHYLHTIYLGARLRLDRLQLAPQLPPRTTSLAITGLDYYGAVVDIQVIEAGYS